MPENSEFWDTNILLQNYSRISRLERPIYISSISLKELEDIKTSARKDEGTKYAARQVVKVLDANPDKIQVVLYQIMPEDCRKEEYTPDEKIISSCLYVRDFLDPDVTFVTNDGCCRLLANYEFCLKAESSLPANEEYLGFKELSLSSEEMANLYSYPSINSYELLANEYLIVKDANGDIVDQMRWDGEQFLPVKIGTLKSDYFGSIKPYKGDPYQMIALNSLTTNQVTMLKGKAGTGKSYLALGYLFYLLDKRKIDKIIVFCNTVATANSAKLGYLPGTRDEKLLDSSIGNMLSAKLGGDYAVERLTAEGKLVLLPMSDIRGYDTSNQRAGVYITEAQNMDISLMKLALQRVGEDSNVIIDGDYNAQVDLAQYAGDNNGMRRMSEVFRGHNFYGEVELQNIYRSKIARVAEAM